MAAKRKHFLRHPKTTQEIKANLDKFDPYVRGRRRKLPTAYDDIFPSPERSWKKNGRKTQYRVADHGYDWHEYTCPHRRLLGGHDGLMDKIQVKLDELGCFYEWTGRGIKWFGPDLGPMKTD